MFYLVLLDYYDLVLRGEHLPRVHLLNANNVHWNVIFAMLSMYRSVVCFHTVLCRSYGLSVNCLVMLSTFAYNCHLYVFIALWSTPLVNDYVIEPYISTNLNFTLRNFFLVDQLDIVNCDYGCPDFPQSFVNILFS